MRIRPADAANIRTLALSEVVLYDGAGTKVPASKLKLELSSTCCSIYPGWPGPFPASMCSNGITDDLCRSLNAADDPSPTLNITYSCMYGRSSLSKVEVHNSMVPDLTGTGPGSINFFMMEVLDGDGKPDKSPYMFSGGESTPKFSVVVTGATRQSIRCNAWLGCCCAQSAV